MNVFFFCPTVQLDLEDPTLLEIAEILDSQAGDKYTVMLVRNGEDVDNASFVHVQMFNEDGHESVRYVCSCTFVHVTGCHIMYMCMCMCLYPVCTCTVKW